MSGFGVVFIALGLSMDAFAVSVSNGISGPGGKGFALKQSAYFGFFQFFMPLLGWMAGRGVKGYIEAADHWTAFIFLAVIGVNMIWNSFCPEEGKKARGNLTENRRLFLQAVATSIDALATGIGYALLNTDIVFAAVVTGILAFIMSFAGVTAGKRLGGVFRKRAELLGGVILILIGVEILITHLFFGR